MAGISGGWQRTQQAPETAEGESHQWLFMSWEDWLTFIAAALAFISIAMSIQDAGWVPGMPPVWPTMLAGILIGMLAARIRLHPVLLQPLAVALGLIVVLLMVQSFADGATLLARLNDFRIRMRDWFEVIGSGDISNDNLPFVTLVQGLSWLAAYVAAWSIYRWRSAWPAVIPGGIILLVNIALLTGHPSGWFIVFLFSAIVLIARLHLQRNQARWQRQGVEYPDFISLNAIQLTLVAASLAILVAWQLPLGGQASATERLFSTLVQPITDQSSTFVRLFHSLEGKKGFGLHAFGDYLTIQGEVKLSNAGVAQVTVNQLPPNTPALARAASYDTYTGAGWKNSALSSTNLPASANAGGAQTAGYESRTEVAAHISLTEGNDTLLTVGVPVSANLPTVANAPTNAPGDVEQLSSQHSLTGGDVYNSVGSVSTASPAQLNSAGTDYPAAIRQRYLQLPAELPQRVKTEAESVAQTASGGGTPYEEALAIAKYLQQFPYALNVPPPPPGRDVVDYFLFTLKRGYFDYNSTAMAVMLRAIGVPARVAVGFYLNPTEQKGKTYAVTLKDTYSWVEVYFPNYGWVTFNPTAPQPTSGVNLNGLSAAGLSQLGLVPPQDLSGLFPTPPTGGTSTSVRQALNQKPTIHGTPPWSLIWSLVGTGIGLLVAAVATRFLWNRGTKHLERRQQLWAKVQRAAMLAGIRSRPYETPREFSRRVGWVVQQEAAARELADAYEEARYGRPGTARGDSKAAERSYEVLRNSLLSGILKRRHLKRRDKELDYRQIG